MKKKKTPRFPLARKGYDRDAVESYIALEQAKADEIQLEQRERVNALKQENETLKLQVETLKGREEQIKLALVSATQNADRMSEDVKRRYKQELDRLRLFRAKWHGAYEQSVAVSVEIELKKFLAQDFSLNKCVSEDIMEAHFRQEVERLTNQQLNCQMNVQSEQTAEPKNTDDLRAKLKEAENKRKAKTSAAFSIEDALNPKNSLEDNFNAIRG